MNIRPFEDHTAKELVTMKEDLHHQIRTADESGDAVAGHDSRCILDQVVAELETRNAAHQDY